VVKGKRFGMVCAAMVMGAAMVGAFADTPATPPTTAPAAQTLASVSFSKTGIATVGTFMKSNDPAKINAILPTIKAWCGQYHVPAELWKDWFPVLQARQQFADIADIALRGLGGRPEAKAYPYLLPARISALIALNQTDEALQAAKSYYNVSDAHHFSNAMTYVILALSKAHPEDPQIGMKFRAGQVSTTQPATPTTSLLQGVTIDATPYAAALAHWKAKSDAGAVADGLDYATLLLIVDRPAEAEPLFRKLMPLCEKAADIATARDGIAASLRAQDQNTLRANQFLATTPLPAATTAPAKVDKSDPLP
jgi:hypothetical protein